MPTIGGTGKPGPDLVADLRNQLRQALLLHAKDITERHNEVAGAALAVEGGVLLDVRESTRNSDVNNEVIVLSGGQQQSAAAGQTKVVSIDIVDDVGFRIERNGRHRCAQRRQEKRCLVLVNVDRAGAFCNCRRIQQIAVVHAAVQEKSRLSFDPNLYFRRTGTSR